MEEWQHRIAFLGPEASFTNLAANAIFPGQWLMPYASIPECIEAVANDQVDYAVVPVENALEGSVPLTIDYLYHEANLYVTAEVLSEIQQHLLVHKQHAQQWMDVKEIYSHPHALAQCHKFLYYTFSKVPQTPYSSTAAAAKLVSETPERMIAAIGNETAAEKYGLEIVQRNVHDFHFNHTRFFVLSKQNTRIMKEKIESEAKTTLMMTLPVDVSGALHQVLSVFAWRKLNLSKIESRPLKTGIGDYFFIVDILADEQDPMMKGAMEELQALGCNVKSLGTYFMYRT
jgi:prephenate dehydratase